MTEGYRIVERIRKLLALANDDGATESEAATAMSMASELMLKYGISRPNRDPTVGKIIALHTRSRTFQPWISRLVLTATKLTACTYLYRQQLDGVDYEIYGNDNNRAAAKLLFDFIYIQVSRWYKTSLESGLTQKDRAEYRRTFKYAAAMTLLSQPSGISAVTISTKTFNFTMASDSASATKGAQNSEFSALCGCLCRNLIQSS